MIELLAASQLAIWLPPERTLRCQHMTMGALADCRVEVMQRRLICEPQGDGAVRNCRVFRRRTSA